MSEMVERVAIAIAGAMPAGAGIADIRGRLFMQEARAAIAAMREPTEAMTISAIDGAGRMVSLEEDLDYTPVWQAMIDRALA